MICQHSHCVGSFEKKDKSLIIYGQGNTLFDLNDIEDWKTGLIIQVTIFDGKLSVDAIPIEKCLSKVQISEKNAEEIFNGFMIRSKEIESDEIIRNKWRSFCYSQRSTLLLRGIMGIDSKLLLGINKLLAGGLLWLLFGRKHRLLLSNYIRCESIREAILDVLDENECKEGIEVEKDINDSAPGKELSGYRRCNSKE